MEAQFLVEKGIDMPISHSQAGQVYPAFRQIGESGSREESRNKLLKLIMKGMSVALKSG